MSKDKVKWLIVGLVAGILCNGAVVMASKTWQEGTHTFDTIEVRSLNIVNEEGKVVAVLGGTADVVTTAAVVGNLTTELKAEAESMGVDLQSLDSLIAAELKRSKELGGAGLIFFDKRGKPTVKLEGFEDGGGVLSIEKRGESGANLTVTDRGTSLFLEIRGVPGVGLIVNKDGTRTTYGFD